jgi:hypothetical protein
VICREDNDFWRVLKRRLLHCGYSPPAIGGPDFGMQTWHLCACDAFNRMMLWKRPIDDLGNRAW